MTFLTKEKADQALKGKTNLLNRINAPVQIIDNLKRERSVEVISDEVKKEVVNFIYENPDMSRQEISDTLGIPNQTIKNIKLGLADESKDVQDHREKKKEQVSDYALSKVMASLGLLTDAKMNGCKATELSAIAANMSKVVSNMAGKNIINDNRTQLVIFSPTQRSEDHFEIIEA